MNFDNNIDYKKLMLQEPEFQIYVRDILFEMMLSQPDTQQLIAFIHSFFVEGIDTDQALRIIKNASRP